MKIQLFLLGAVTALTLGALSVAGSVPVASKVATPARTSSPSHSPSSSHSSSPSSSPESTPEFSAGTVIVPVIADSTTPATSSSAHPCNHGFYVSQVAHGHHGGKFTSTVAKSDLGKDGDCTKPVPTPTSTDSSISPSAGTDSNQAETEVESDSH